MSKDITLVIVDNTNHDLAKFSIEQTLKNIDCKEVITFSNKEIIAGAKFVPIRGNINLYDYSEIVLKQLWCHIETEHVLVTQWDGMAAHKDMWTDEFLKYDYIGGVWPWAIHGRHMGNGGFSLRSRKLIEACRDREVRLGGISEQNEDIAICVEYRRLLEDKYGINYAPLELAAEFSTENYCKGNSFGFHGIWNAAKFLDEVSITYILEHMPKYVWKDTSKAVAWIRELEQRGLTDLVQLSKEQL